MKRRTIRGIGGAVLCAVLLGVFLLFKSAYVKPAKTSTAKDFTARGQVLAMQLSESAFGRQTYNPKNGYLVLTDASGKTRVFHSGKMGSGEPIWTATGIFYGGAESEYPTNEQGTKIIPRDTSPDHEYARYQRDKGRGFIAFYALGSDPGGYQQPVLVGDSEKTKSFDVRGAYMSMGVCDDILYAVAQTKLAPNLLEQAKAVYQKHAGVTNAELAAIDNFDILVQVYPANHPKNPKVLESFPRDPRFSHPVREFQRVNDSIYLLSFLLDHPNAQRGDGKDPWAGHLVLEEWNLKQHTRRAIDIVDNKGSFIDITVDGAGGEKGILLGNEYRFVTRTGKVMSVGVMTGSAKHLYTFEKLPDGGDVPRFDITPQAVYRLDDGKEDSSMLNFSRYVFKTEKYEHLFDVESLEKYRQDDVHIEGIAVNPIWEKTLPQ